MYKLIGASGDGSFYANVLASEGTNSFLDLYETLLVCFRKLSGSHTISPQTPQLVFNLLRDVQDERKDALEYVYTGGKSGKLRVAESYDGSAYSDFYYGNYKSAAEKALQDLDRHPTNISALILLGKLEEYEIPTPAKNDFRLKLIDHYRNIFSCNEKAASSVEWLETISLNLQHANFAGELLLPIKARNVGRGGEQRALAVELLMADTFVPPSAVLSLCGDKFSGLQRERCAVWQYEWSMRGYHDKETSVMISEEAAMYARTICLLRGGYFDDAVEAAYRLASTTKEYYRAQGELLQVLALHRGLRVVEALKSSVALVIARKGALQFTPLISIVERKSYRDLKELRDDPILSIAFYIFGKHTSSIDREVALKVSWREYLKSQNCSKPSELIERVTRWTPELLYFFRDVCSQEVMELGGAFSSQIDLDKERINICYKLSKIDSGYQDAADREIVDLTRRIQIEEGVETVESSRVFVDELGLMKWARGNLDALFQRYLYYLKAGLVRSSDELEAVMQDFLRDRVTKATAQSFLDSYDISSEIILEEVLGKLATAFLNAPRYGLDSFLSARIRHGSFVGYIRAPFEAKRFLTKQDKNGTYYENTELISRWGICDPADQKSASDILTVFSSSIDKLLDDFSSRYICVKSKLRPEGIIEFGEPGVPFSLLLKRWVIITTTELNEHTSIDDLTASCVANLFWPGVASSLGRMDSFIRGVLRKNLLSQIAILESKVEHLVGHSNSGQFRSDIAIIKDEVGRVIARVASWFQPPQSVKNTFLLRTSVEVGEISTKNARPSFKPDVKWIVGEAANIEISAIAFGLITDISFLIFENISKHAGFEEQPGTMMKGPRVDVALAVDGAWVTLRVVSDIHPSKDLEEIKSAVKKAKNRIKARDVDAVTEESRGTGLVRLSLNSLRVNDQSNDDDVDFGIEEGRFYVKVSLPRRALEVIVAKEAQK